MDELNALLQSMTTSTNGGTSDTLKQLLAWTVVPSIVFFGAFLVYFAFHIIHRHRVDKAIFEIRDNLREMKARQTINANPSTPHETPVSDNKIKS